MSNLSGVTFRALCLALATLLCAATSYGAPPQVRIDVSPADSAVVPLLRAELEELGLSVVEAPSPGTPSLTVRVVLTRSALEVSVVDDTTGRDTAHESFSVASGRTMDPRTAVLHAVELLRWQLSFKESHEPEAPTPRVVAEPAPPPTPARERPVALGFSLLPLALYSPGGTRLGLGGGLDLLVRRRWLGARVLGATSMVPNRLTVPEGTLEVTPSWGGLQGALLLDVASATTLELGVGAALLSTRLRGISQAENLGADDHLLTFAPLADVRLRQHVTSGFAVGVGAACLLPLEASRLKVLDREVGRYGQALLALGLGLELSVL